MQRLADSRFAALVLLGCAMALAAGCGSSDKDVGGTQAADSSQQATPADEMANLTGPAATVRDFLEGARRGDDTAVLSLLTGLARQNQAKHGFQVAPPRDDNARFMIGEVETPNEQIARVACRWIEMDPVTEQVVKSSDATYVLRNEPEGWRIGGVARTVIEGEPPLLLNYEDPEDMVRQAQMLQAEMERRAKAAAGQSSGMARSPEAPSQR